MSSNRYINMHPHNWIKGIAQIFLLCLLSCQISATCGNQSDWPVFRSNLNHTGCVSGSLRLEMLLWRYNVNDWVISSPVISDGTLFVASLDGRLYALDSVTGNLLWQYSTERDITSSPAVSGDYVFIGCHNGNIYAFDRSDGDLEWTYTINGTIMSSPAVADGVVFVGSNDHKVYALNRSTGELLWGYTTGGQVRS
ncbi:MAG TPA: hypothetical protein ENG12_04355, partial [Candidatus Altiarchaeales archaeon]|nr:hypothetical protein [Candidatus Altiarchaeales archaeon]